MRPSTYRIIGCPVRDPDQAIEHNDSLAYPRRLPDGRVIPTSRQASDYPKVIGIPAHVMIEVGFTIYEQWLCEVRDEKIIRRVVRVLGPAYALEERPTTTGHATAAKQ